MTGIEVIEKPALDEKRRALVLGYGWPVEARLCPRAFRLDLFARVRRPERRTFSRRDRNLCVARRAGAVERGGRRHRSLGAAEVDDRWHWRRMEGRGSRGNRPLVSAPVPVLT